MIYIFVFILVRERMIILENVCYLCNIVLDFIICVFIFLFNVLFIRLNVYVFIRDLFKNVWCFFLLNIWLLVYVYNSLYIFISNEKRRNE